jgi:hypothetical protein
MLRSDQGGSGLGLSDWSNPRLPESPEVLLSYARVLGRVLGGEVLIQNLIERVIQGILVSLCRIIYLLLELSWAACANGIRSNGIRYVVCEGAFQFDFLPGI